MDELADVRAARVLTAPRTPTKREQEEHDFFTCLIYLRVCSMSWEEDWSDATTTMTNPECLLTTDTSAETQHHCWLQMTDAQA